MKKFLFYSLILFALASVGAGLTSCSKDDEGEKNLNR